MLLFRRNADAKAGARQNFQVYRDDAGIVRNQVWDKFCTWGEKAKDGVPTSFDEVTLPQMVMNWKQRGDELMMDYNHQSCFVEQNGQPAPALAWYNALAVVRDGQMLCFQSLKDDVQPPGVKGLADGMYGHRSEVTELGQQLLPGFKYISPTFSPEGSDEQGNPIGYVLHAVAATNTPFQAGTSITFEQGAGRPKGNVMEETVMKKLGLEAGADDESVKAAYTRKMADAGKMLAEGEPSDMRAMADELNELAGHYESAFEEDKDGPPQAMRKMAARMSRFAGEPECPPARMDADDGDEKVKQEYMALANRLGVNLTRGSSSKQMFDAITAATVSVSQIPALVDTRVKQAMAERESQRLRDETKSKANSLVAMAIQGGYPESQKSALLSFASDPKTFAAAEAMVKPFLGQSQDTSVLFSRMTSAGAPTGVDTRQQSASGRDRRIVRNELATFVVEGERFSTMAKEWADAKEGQVKMKIDGLLSDSEQAHSGYRLIAANRLLKQERPDLWAQAEEQDI